MRAPKVSVVMPVHNGQQYLGLAIESILQQTFGDFEFLIVNDSSTDRSAEIMESYAARDPRVVLIKPDRRGLAEALNAGCRIARADYVARMDCDDIARPDRFARQVEYLDRHPDVAVLGGAAQLIDAEGRPLAELRYAPEGESLRDALDNRNCVIHPAVMMRRSVFGDVGFYRQSCAPAEDYDLWTRIADNGVVMNLPGAVLIDFRMHDSQVSNTKRRRQLVIAMAVQRATAARRKSGTDPLARYDDVNEYAARDLGVTESEVDQAYIDIEYQRAVNLMCRLGPDAFEKARVVFNALQQQGFTPAGCAYLNRMHDDFETAVQVETIRRLVRRRRYVAAAIQSLVAGIRRPRVWMRIFSSVRRGSGSRRFVAGRTTS